MTSRQKRALYRVRNACRRLVKAIEHLDTRDLSILERASLAAAVRVSSHLAKRLTEIVEP